MLSQALAAPTALPRSTSNTHGFTRYTGIHKGLGVENPFRPTAGAEPPHLIGRVGVLDEFVYGLRIRSGAPGLLTIFTGARGIGKTVMLGEAEDAARSRGWAVISETATRGFLGRIGESIRHYGRNSGKGRPNVVSLASVSPDSRSTPSSHPNSRRHGDNSGRNCCIYSTRRAPGC